MSSKENIDVKHWADQAAERVIKEKGNKKQYTVAAGITPSGVVHIGNFREIITVDLVKRALESKGKNVRFIYSWDDFDVFRKVPKEMPRQKELEKQLRKPIVDVLDPYGTEKSYARHHEVAVEKDVALADIHPEFIYQAQEYRKGRYAKEIQHALKKKDSIIAALNKHRSEPLGNDWLPVGVFSKKFGTDNVKNIKYDGKSSLSYELEDGTTETVDFSKGGNVKLKWRVDWPMRWAFEQVDFEPGGKDHSTVGGSFDTGKLIVKSVWDRDAPTYVMYNFISVKGGAGKMSSSAGGVVTLGELLEVYEPEIVRWFFAGTRPSAEFAISFDADVIKYYEDFDRCERIYFGQEDAGDKEKVKQSRIYELSVIGKPSKVVPIQPGFRHLTMVLQINGMDVAKAIGYFEKEIKNKHDRKRLEQRALCAKNWLEKYAPDEFKFSVQEKAVSAGLSKKQKDALHTLAEKLKEREWGAVDLQEEFYIISQNHELDVKEFFTAAYTSLIGKEKGPRLAGFIIEIGRKKVAELIGNV